MAYIHRSDESDLYLTRSLERARGKPDVHAARCYRCKLTKSREPDPKFTSKHDLIQHLCAHAYAGHKVPARVFTLIREDTWLGE